MGSKKQKGKNQSKPKRAILPPVQSQPIKQPSIAISRCQSCGQKFQEESIPQDLIHCSKCLKHCHRFCYLPNSKDNNNQFICDVCAYPKNHPRCQICNSQKGLMKSLENKKDTFVHIRCALMNYKTIYVSSYLSMSFEEKTDNTHQIRKNSKAGQKCQICQTQPGMGSSLIKCKKCDFGVHGYCVKNGLANSQNWQQIIGYMDKNNFTFRNIKFLAKFNDHFNPISFFEKRQSQDQPYVLCPNHKQQEFFNYCFCSDENANALKDQKQKMLCACKSCERWVHFKCSKLHDDKDQFECQACRNKDYLKQLMSWQRLIKQVCQMQKDVLNKLKGVKNKVEWMKHIPLPMSKKIADNLMKSKDQVLKYLVNQYLAQVCQQLKSKTQSNLMIFFNEHKLTQFMYSCSIHPQPLQKDHGTAFQEMAQCILKSFSSVKFISKENKDVLFNIFKTKVTEPNKISIQSQPSAIQSNKLTQSKKSQRNVHNNSSIDKSNEQSQMIKIAKQKIQSFTIKAKQYLGKKNYFGIIQEQLKSLNAILLPICAKQKISIKQLFGGQNNILSLLVQHLISKDLISQSFELYRYLEEIKATNKYTKQSIYYQTNKFLRKLNEQAKTDFTQLFKPLTTKVKRNAINAIRFNSYCYENRLNKNFGCKQIQKIQNFIANNQIYLPQTSIFKDAHEDQSYYKILKQKCLKAIKNQNLTSAQTNKLIPQLNKLVTSGSLFLTQKQMIQFKRFSMKYQFYNRLILKYKQSCPQTPVQNVQESNQMKDQNQQDQKNIFNQVKNIFQSEKIVNLVPQDLIKQFSQAYQAGIQFHDYEKAVLATGLDIVLSALNDHIQTTSFKELKPRQLKRLNNVLKCFNMTQKFPKYQQQWKKYRDWLKPLEAIFVHQALQDQDQNEKLQHTLDQMLDNKDTLSIKVNEDIKVIGTLRLWTKLSKKYFQIFEFKRRRRPTINAVQQFKDLLYSVKYPNNKISNKIIQYQNEAKSLNKMINRFLQRPKNIQQEICEQFVSYLNKITIEQSYRLLDCMKSCSLDVSSQMQELQAFIKDFKKIQNAEYQKALLSNNLGVLQTFKKKLIQLPIRSDDQTIYQKLIRKIYQIKAIEFCPPINKNQFKKIQTYGGYQAANLLKTNHKAYNLAKAYKTIQRAQRQIFITPNLRNQKALLQLSDSKRLLWDLQLDPQQKSRVQKWFETAKINKDKTNKMKSGKMQDYQKLRIRQQEMYRIPVSMKDVINQHTNMKRQYQYIMNHFKGQSLGNILQQCTTTFLTDQIKRYRNNGIRSQAMDRLIKDWQRYSEILRLKLGYLAQNYKVFSVKCMHSSDIANIQAIWKARKQYFQNMYNYVLHMQQISLQLINTLIEQGSQIHNSSHMKKHDKKNYTQYLLKLLNTKNEIFGKQQSSQDISEQEQMEEEEEFDDSFDDSLDQQDSSNDYNNQDSQDDFDDQDPDQNVDKELQQGQSKSKNNGKRPPPVINLDDQS